jgi:hypothetical protein
MQSETQIQPVRPRIVRSYSSQERREAVAAYNQVGNLEKVSEALGIPISTLSGWTLTPALYSPKNRSNLADKFEFAANFFIDIAVKKAKKAGFSHLMTAAGIAVDKMQLLRGQPTSISETIERQELTIVLADALADAIDVTP